ncbi:MAG: hypothetical protein ND866_26580 [Pyrinomonadaceae bacterium]|nr:hypothetical protein [Pyrinomonadaceae bacterium]
MRRILISLLLTIPLSLTVTGQSRTFTSAGLEYALDLPSPSWQAESRVDVHEHLEFIYDKDNSNGYLRLRKKFVAPGSTPQDLFRHDETWDLLGLPGYVVCSDGIGATFEGHLKGTMFSYEYVNKGRSMDGRIYYLQMDNRTFYILHFTVRSDKLQTLRGEMESMARSFRLK